MLPNLMLLLSRPLFTAQCCFRGINRWVGRRFPVVCVCPCVMRRPNILACTAALWNEPFGTSPFLRLVLHVSWNFNLVHCVHKWTENCPSVGVAAYWPKPTYLTSSPADRAHFPLFLQGRTPPRPHPTPPPPPCILTHTVAHTYLLAAQLNLCCPPLTILGHWAALLKQFGQHNRGDQEHQNSCWVFYSFSVPPAPSLARNFFFFIQWEDWNQWPSKHILASLILRPLSLLHVWQWWYQCERFCRFMYRKVSFSPPFPRHSLSLLTHNLLRSPLAGCRPEYWCSPYYALSPSIIMFMGYKNMITLFKGEED